MKFAILLALFVAVAIGSGVKGSLIPLHKKGGNNNGVTNDDATTPNFGSALLGFVMAFQNIMPCGFTNWNLPSLAPFTLESWPFNFHNQYYSVSGVANNIVISDLNDFRILQFNYDENSGKITFDVIYYEIQLLAEYRMEAWAMVAGYNASMIGNGPLNWRIKDLRYFGEVTIGSNGGDGTKISDFNMNFLVGDVIPDNWNYNWDISFNNFFNKWVREFILMWVQEFQGDVNNFYNGNLLPKDNQALQNINMNQIISFFVQETQLMNEANCKPAQS